MRIALSADHAGVELKDALAAWLGEAGHDLIDLGTHGTASVDYPDYGARLAGAVGEGKADRGIAVCGSGIGIAIAANRNPAGIFYRTIFFNLTTTSNNFISLHHIIKGNCLADLFTTTTK